MAKKKRSLLKKKGKAQAWFWPCVIGATALLGFFLMYFASSFLSDDSEGIDFAFEKGFKTLATLGMVWILIRLYSVIGSALYQKRLGTPMPGYLISGFNWGVILMAVMFIIVVIFEKPAWSLIAAGGFVGAGLALAVQGLILDVFSGIVLDVENNFKPNEWLKLPSGDLGWIVKSSWRSVTIQTPEGVIHVIPNGKLTSEGFQNLSRPFKGFYDRVEISIDHDVPIARAERLLHGSMLTIPEIAKNKKFEAYAYKATEGGIIYRLRYHVGDFAKYREIKHKVLEAATRYLHKNGLKVSETIGEYSLSKAQNDLILRDEVQGIDVLPQVDLFQTLTLQEQEQLAKKMIRLQFDIGEDIIKENDKGNSMFIIAEGAVEVLKEIKKKDSVTLSPLTVLGPSSFFGDMGLLLGEKRTATVRAKSPVLVFEIPKAALSPILKKRPTLAKFLSETVAKRQAHTAKKLERFSQKVEQESLTANQILKGIKSFFKI